MKKTSRHVVLAQMCDVFRHLFSPKEISFNGRPLLRAVVRCSSDDCALWSARI